MKCRQFRCDSEKLRQLLEDTLPPETTRNEVIGHLDNCAVCQSNLEELAADPKWWADLQGLNTLDAPHERQMPQQGPEKAPDTRANILLDFLDPGDEPGHLGRMASFRVTEILGHGGFGIVLKAFDAALNRHVAIKVLAPHFASSGAARKRFDREAKAAATVMHPHVVPIYSVDVWKGLPYLVMAYVPGRSLQDLLDTNGSLEVKEIVRIGMQAASGLAAAHAQGLVHRDVKPANILLENGLGRVWLTDFGLARAVDDASLTQSGVIAGTPQYMSPEQAQGDAIDHRADLFCLGSTLYAMCTGHAPFRAESALAVLRRVCDDAARPIRQVNPDIPGWLTGLIEKLHAKKPENRFQSASEVADRFRQCLAHLEQPGANKLPPDILALAPLPSHRRGLRWLAAILLVFGLVILAPFIGKRQEEERVPEIPRPGEGESIVRPVRKDPPAPKSPEPSFPSTRDPIDEQIKALQKSSTAFDKGFRQFGMSGYGDPMQALLDDTRRRLILLEQELTVSTSGKSAGIISSSQGALP